MLNTAPTQPEEEQPISVVEHQPVPRVREVTSPAQPEDGEKDDTPTLPAPPCVPVQHDKLDDDDLGIVQPAFGF